MRVGEGKKFMWRCSTSSDPFFRNAWTWHFSTNFLQPVKLSSFSSSSDVFRQVNPLLAGGSIVDELHFLLLFSPGFSSTHIISLQHLDCDGGAVFAWETDKISRVEIKDPHLTFRQTFLLCSAEEVDNMKESLFFAWSFGSEGLARFLLCNLSSLLNESKWKAILRSSAFSKRGILHFSWQAPRMSSGRSASYHVCCSRKTEKGDAEAA